MPINFCDISCQSLQDIGGTVRRMFVIAGIVLRNQGSTVPMLTTLPSSVQVSFINSFMKQSWTFHHEPSAMQSLRNAYGAFQQGAHHHSKEKYKISLWWKSYRVTSKHLKEKKKGSWRTAWVDYCHIPFVLSPMDLVFWIIPRIHIFPCFRVFLPSFYPSWNDVSPWTPSLLFLIIYGSEYFVIPFPPGYHSLPHRQAFLL